MCPRNIQKSCFIRTIKIYVVCENGRCAKSGELNFFNMDSWKKKFRFAPPQACVWRYHITDDNRKWPGTAANRLCFTIYCLSIFNLFSFCFFFFVYRLRPSVTARIGERLSRWRTPPRLRTILFLCISIWFFIYIYIVFEIKPLYPFLYSLNFPRQIRYRVLYNIVLDVIFFFPIITVLLLNVILDSTACNYLLSARFQNPISPPYVFFQY